MRKKQPAKNLPPARLEKLIHLINLIAPDTRLPDLEGEIENLKLEDFEVQQRLYEILKSLPDEVSNYIYPYNLETIKELTSDYFDEEENLRDNREFLYEIVQGYQDFSRFTKILRSLIQRHEAQKNNRLIIIFPIYISTEIVIKDGLIHIETNKLAEALQGVDIDRLRICPVCNRIFWAKRNDQKACSNKCSGNLRIRKYRENYLEKYKQQRIKKEQTIKS